MSLNDDSFSFQINSNIGKSKDGGSSKSPQLDALEATEIFMNNDHVKQCAAKKVRLNLDESISSGRSSPLRKIPQKEKGLMENSDVKKCESVKNLMEVQNGLKSMENERRTSPLNDAERFSGPNRTNWENSLFDLNNTGVEFLRHCPERASTGKIKSIDYSFPIRPKSGTKSATALENLKEAEKQLIYGDKYNSKIVLLVGSEKSLNEAHKRAFKAAGGKILCKKDSKSAHGSKESVTKGNSNLKIRIAKSPIATDSSNEYETDTGIPKSPTLFISGVSISRTPEPPTSSTKQEKKSPEHKIPKLSPVLKDLSHRSMQGKNNSSPVLNLIPPSVDFDNRNEKDFRGLEENLFFPEKFDEKFLTCGRQGRSASLTVAKSDGQKESGKINLNSSCNAISSCHNERKSNGRKEGCQVLSFSPRNSVMGLGENEKSMENEIPLKSSEGVFIFPTFNHKESKEDLEHSKIYENGLAEYVKKTGKSKSASEPEREREMFRFPKSSTDGALSSVLHVQESNLSSDDFHEVLFLLERSPKHGSKRKKKSKKERDKVKENSNKDECTEVSSAL